MHNHFNVMHLIADIYFIYNTKLSEVIYSSWPVIPFLHQYLISLHYKSCLVEFLLAASFMSKEIVFAHAVASVGVVAGN